MSILTPEINSCEDALVSIIIPAYNAARYIREAVRSAQKQTYSPIEIIVVDDGSQDDTTSVVDQMASNDARIHLVTQPNQGVAQARNRGINESRGEFIAPLDADDIWFPCKLKRQVQRMEQAGPTTGLVYSWWAYLNNEGEIYRIPGRPRFEGNVYEAHIHENFIGNASVPLFRRESLERVGLYDPAFRAQGAGGCEDWDLTLRVAAEYEFSLVREHLSAYRAAEKKDVERNFTMSDDTVTMARGYESMMNDIKERHPDIPEYIFKWSASNFYDYLATKSYKNNQFSNALYWLIKIARVDPAVLLSSRFWGMMAKGSVRSASYPLSQKFWEDPQNWKVLKNWIRHPYSAIRSERRQKLEADLTQQQQFPERAM